MSKLLPALLLLVAVQSSAAEPRHLLRRLVPHVARVGVGLAVPKIGVAVPLRGSSTATRGGLPPSDPPSTRRACYPSTRTRPVPCDPPSRR